MTGGRVPRRKGSSEPCCACYRTVAGANPHGQKRWHAMLVHIANQRAYKVRLGCVQVQGKNRGMAAAHLASGAATVIGSASWVRNSAIACTKATVWPEVLEGHRSYEPH